MLRLPVTFPAALALLGSITSSDAQTSPEWWTSRGATNANPPNDHAVVTQGQLKHFTQMAAEELNARIPGGAGGELNALVDGWILEYQNGNHSAQNPLPSDFHAMTAGQLKWIANKISDRLIHACYLDAPAPWLNADAGDTELVNIGQLKTVFNFDLTAPLGQLPEWWELYYFGGLGIADPDATLIPNGLTNQEKADLGLSLLGDDLLLADERITYSYDGECLNGVNFYTRREFGYTLDGNGNIETTISD